METTCVELIGIGMIVVDNLVANLPLVINPMKIGKDGNKDCMYALEKRPKMLPYSDVEMSLLLHHLDEDIETS